LLSLFAIDPRKGFFQKRNRFFSAVEIRQEDAEICGSLTVIAIERQRAPEALLRSLRPQASSAAAQSFQLSLLSAEPSASPSSREASSKCPEL
jgi:hypothetical protein